MWAYLTLTRRELGGHFGSLRGYVIIAGAQLLLGLILWQILILRRGEFYDTPISAEFPRQVAFWVVVLLISPLITMRTFAQEKATGTYETLMTAPVSDLQVVLAKFTGSLLFFLAAFTPALCWPVLFHYYTLDFGEIDHGLLFGLLLGISLIGSMLCSLGCFASSLTRSQIIAATTSFVLGMGFFILGLLAFQHQGETGWQASLLGHVSMRDHLRAFAAGIVDARHVVFYISLTSLFLFFTLKVLESRRWR